MHITKTIEFDAGHRLMNHKGKCWNAHGHRYKVDLSLMTERLDSVGRVLDFDVVKSTVGWWVNEHWDHGFLYEEGDEVGEKLRASGMKVFRLPWAPTAEVMAVVLFRLSTLLLAQHRGAMVTGLVLWETPTSRAEVNRQCLFRRDIVLPEGAWVKLFKLPAEWRKKMPTPTEVSIGVFPTVLPYKAKVRR